MGIDIDAAEIVRRLVAWGQGRMDERLLWMFARKCGDCMDWAIDIAGKHDTNVTLWEGYYKGPTYTEFPVTHQAQRAILIKKSNRTLINF